MLVGNTYGYSKKGSKLLNYLNKSNPYEWCRDYMQVICHCSNGVFFFFFIIFQYQ